VTVTLRKRCDRLEAKRGGAGAGPSVIFLYNATTGEPGGALLAGGGGGRRLTPGGGRAGRNTV